MKSPKIPHVPPARPPRIARLARSSRGAAEHILRLIHHQHVERSFRLLQGDLAVERIQLVKEPGEVVSFYGMALLLEELLPHAAGGHYPPEGPVPGSSRYTGALRLPGQPVPEQAIEADEEHPLSRPVAPAGRTPGHSSVLPVPAAPSKRHLGLAASSSRRSYCSPVRLRSLSSVLPSETDLATTRSKLGLKVADQRPDLGCGRKRVAAVPLELV